MRITCVREGRAGFEVGDTLEIPDSTTVFDTNYFARDDGPLAAIVEEFDRALAQRHPRPAYRGKQEEA
jgi:hypothetical protein